MIRLESLLVAYVFNSLWQVPLACIAAALAARTLRQAGAHAQHRVWVVGLLAGALFPALSLLPLDQAHLGWMFAASAHPAVQGEVSIQMGPGTGYGGLWLPPAVLRSVVLAYCALLVWFVLRFAWRCVRVSSLQRESRPLSLDARQSQIHGEYSSGTAVARVLVAESPHVFAPVAVGIRRKAILLPCAFSERLAPADFDMVLAHEFAHLRRDDFLKNLCYELIALPVSYHPLFWLIRQRLMETREMVCDELAAQVSGKPAYVQSLLRLASLLVEGLARPLPHGVGVFDANTLERRLMKLTRNAPSIGHARRAALIALTLVLAAGAATSALALRLSLDPAALSAEGSSNAPPEIVRPDVLARNAISKVPPVYPPDAKKAHIQGVVVLDTVIGKTGDVENLKVVSGPKELQQSALDAVRQWKYKPFLVNSSPVEVKSTINITYSLHK